MCAATMSPRSPLKLKHLHVPAIINLPDLLTLQVQTVGKLQLLASLHR